MLSPPGSPSDESSCHALNCDLNPLSSYVKRITPISTVSHGIYKNTSGKSELQLKRKLREMARLKHNFRIKQHEAARSLVTMSRPESDNEPDLQTPNKRFVVGDAGLRRLFACDAHGCRRMYKRLPDYYRHLIHKHNRDPQEVFSSEFTPAVPQHLSNSSNMQVLKRGFQRSARPLKVHCPLCNLHAVSLTALCKHIGNIHKTTCTIRIQRFTNVKELDEWIAMKASIDHDLVRHGDGELLFCRGNLGKVAWVSNEKRAGTVTEQQEENDTSSPRRQATDNVNEDVEQDSPDASSETKQTLNTIDLDELGLVRLPLEMQMVKEEVDSDVVDVEGYEKVDSYEEVDAESEEDDDLHTDDIANCTAFIHVKRGKNDRCSLAAYYCDTHTCGSHPRGMGKAVARGSIQSVRESLRCNEVMDMDGVEARHMLHNRDGVLASAARTRAKSPLLVSMGEVEAQPLPPMKDDVEKTAEMNGGDKDKNKLEVMARESADVWRRHVLMCMQPLFSPDRVADPGYRSMIESALHELHLKAAKYAQQ